MVTTPPDSSSHNIWSYSLITAYISRIDENGKPASNTFFFRKAMLTTPQIDLLHARGDSEPMPERIIVRNLVTPYYT
jgi:hypothetical protein